MIAGLWGCQHPQPGHPSSNCRRNQYLTHLHVFSADVFIAWSCLSSKLPTIQGAIWMRSVRFGALGIALDTPPEGGGAACQQDEAGRKWNTVLFPTLGDSLEQQADAYQSWQTTTILQILSVWEPAGQGETGLTTGIFVLVSLITPAFSFS